MWFEWLKGLGFRSTARPQVYGTPKNYSIDITVSTKQGSSSILSTQQKIQRGDIKNDKSIHSTRDTRQCKKC